MRAVLSWLLVVCVSGLACSPQTVDAISSKEQGTVNDGGSGGTGHSTPAAGAGTRGGGANRDPDDDGGQSGSPGEAGSSGDGSEGGASATLRGDALLHRYSFDGMGTTALDSKGGAHGTVVKTELNGDGTLTLAGAGSGQYLDLPDGLISGLGDATFEAWVTWAGGKVWQRIFDFGSRVEAPNGTLHGRTYLFLTPKADYSERLRAAFSLQGAGEAELVLDATRALPEDEISHVALVVDDRNDAMLLYLDGVLEKQVEFFDSLSGINDVNNWLGKSQFDADADFGGVIHEFRIYDAALSADEILVSFEAGPQAVFPSP